MSVDGGPRTRAAAVPALLRLLFDDVAAAKAAEREQLAQRGTHAVTLASTRRDCLRALEAYADALERRHWPVPRRIQQDIRLHRALCEVNAGAIPNQR